MLHSLVLSAGLSRRMGPANKMLLPLADSTILAMTVQNVLAANISLVAVVTGYEADAVKTCLSGFPVQWIHNERYETGMTSSIQAGVAAASAEAQGYLIGLGDMPFLQPDEYRQLADFFQRQLAVDPFCIVVPVFEGQPGHPVIFSAAHRAAILALDFPDGCKPIVAANRQHVAYFSFDTDHCLRDLDTPEAYRAAFFDRHGA
jgi:molybdenum cofactor cytidylyltransferase